MVMELAIRDEILVEGITTHDPLIRHEVARVVMMIIIVFGILFGKKMKKIFAMWTTCSMASLALPGMSGFVAELMVFIGFATSDAYNFTFKVIMVSLAAVGVILTPIYLLSMLREMLYGPENKELVSHANLIDAEPREVFIIACLLIPIIGIGFYPKIVTQIYDSTTHQLTALIRNSVPSLQTAHFPREKYNNNQFVALKAPSVK